MFNWLKRLFRFPQARDIFDKMDEDNKEQGIRWHYECENGHEWSTNASPTGSFCATRYGLTQSQCPWCDSFILKAEEYKNGELTGAGAMHVDFKKKKRKKK